MSMTQTELLERLRALKGIKGNDLEEVLKGSLPAAHILQMNAILNKRKRAKLTQEQIDKIISVYDEFDGDTRAVGAALGHGASTIYRHWIRAGLEPKDNGDGRISPREIEKILSVYQTCKGVARKAARMLGHKQATIRKYWRLAGFKAKGKGGHESFLTQAEIDKIIAAHRQFRGSASRAAAHLCRAIKTIQKYWKMNGLKSRIAPLSKKDIDKIIAIHEECAGVAYRASRIIGHNEKTIEKYWVQAGLELRKRKNDNDQPLIQKIIEAYKEFDGNATSAADHLGCKYERVLYQWWKAGLEARGWYKQKGLPPSEVEKIIGAYEEFNGNAHQAFAAVGYSLSTVIRYWRYAGLEPIGRSLPSTEIDKIIAAHKQFSGDAQNAAQALKHSQGTIQRYWKRAKLYPKSRNAVRKAQGVAAPAENQIIFANEDRRGRLTPEEVDCVLEHHYLAGGDVALAASMIGFSEPTIRKYWKKNNLKPVGPCGIMLEPLLNWS